MASVIAKLEARGVVRPPPWLVSNLVFEGETGSVAYGCGVQKGDAGGLDLDLVGVAIAPKQMVFPHLAGHIPGFGTPPPTFNHWQQHHVADAERRAEVDATVYGLVRFFELARENNPNIVDVLFTPRRCIRHTTGVWEHVREHRRRFIHKGCYHRFRDYAYSQLSKLRRGTTRASRKRQASIEAHGFDTKFAYHIVRLALECEQLLESGEMVLDRDGALYRSIRAGEWNEERIVGWFEDKERSLERLYGESALPHEADEEALRRLLLECLEMHYGSLAAALADDTRHARLLRGLETLLVRHR